jgi:hypothetical protein
MAQQLYRVWLRVLFFVAAIAGPTLLVACSEAVNPAAPTEHVESLQTSAAHSSIDERGLRLLKGSVVTVEPVDGSWNFVRITTTLKGQRGFRADASGGETSYAAVLPCLDVGCAPGTPLPLRLFIYSGNAIGEARLQGQRFEIGGAMGGFGDTGLVVLTFGGTSETPLSMAGTTTVSAPFTFEGRLLFPSGLPAPDETPLIGSGRAILSFEWQQFPFTASEGWMVTSARYVFD